MASWTYNKLTPSDKNYIDSYSAAGWQAFTLVMDIHNADPALFNNQTKLDAIAALIAIELNLSNPSVNWITYTGGKLMVMVVGQNTVTARLMDTGTIYLEAFVTAAYPPEYLSRQIMGLVDKSDTYFTNHMIPRK
jgi:hypothetical protein